MRNLAQAGEDLFQDLRCQDERVTTGEQHIAHLRSAAQVFQLKLELSPLEGGRWVAYDAAARAVAAVGSALGGNQHQHPVGVAVHQARDG